MLLAHPGDEFICPLTHQITVTGEADNWVLFVVLRRGHGLMRKLTEATNPIYTSYLAAVKR